MVSRVGMVRAAGVLCRIIARLDYVGVTVKTESLLGAALSDLTAHVCEALTEGVDVVRLARVKKSLAVVSECVERLEAEDRASKKSANLNQHHVCLHRLDPLTMTCCVCGLDFIKAMNA